MPSLANSKQQSENKPSDSSGESPVNAILTIIEHKIRNLEKRKTKLDGYRELQKKGESLSADQKEACRKYEEVKHSLDLAKEFCKQFTQIAKEANREAKRESKRNAFLRVQQESNKIREVLIIQDILRMLADDSVRQDFLDGTNGAVRIEQADMDLLEKLYVEVTPKRPTRSDEPNFIQSATHSANTLSSVIDSRPKAFGESTYEHVKNILQNIQTCGYFEREIIQVEPKVTDVESNIDATAEEAKLDEGEKLSESELAPEFIEAPAANSVPQPEALILPNNPTQQQSQAPVQNVQPMPIPNIVPAVPVVNPLLPGGPAPLPATTVRAVEHGYYKQYIQQQIQQPPLRPEQLIGTGNFFFLQESELDSSDMLPTAGFTVQPGQPSPQQKQAATMIPVQQANAPPQGSLIANTTAAPQANSIVPNTGPLQQSGQANPMTLPTSFAANQNFPSMVQPIFNANTMKTGEITNPQQAHIPAFTNQVSPQIPLQVPSGSAQQQPTQGPIIQPSPVLSDPIRTIPSFVTQNQQMAQIAQLQNMIQQQQHQQQHQQMSNNASVAIPNANHFTQQSKLDADDLTEKLKSTLHINDNKPTSNNNASGNDSATASKPSTPNINHRTGSTGSRDFDLSNDSQNEINTKDWNDVNESNSWSNQMAEENNRTSSDRYKRNSGGNGNSNNMYSRSDKYSGSGGSGTYRSRNSNTYQSQNGNRMSNNGGDQSSGVFFRNNDRYYQNGNKDSYMKPGGGATLGYNKPRNDMMRPPRMSGNSVGGAGDYRPRSSHNRSNGGAGPGQMQNGPGVVRDNRAGLKP